jgi:hypothetical protein
LITLHYEKINFSDDNKKFTNIFFGQNAKILDIKENSACICEGA